MGAAAVPQVPLSLALRQHQFGEVSVIKDLFLTLLLLWASYTVLIAVFLQRPHCWWHLGSDKWGAACRENKPTILGHQILEDASGSDAKW